MYYNKPNQIIKDMTQLDRSANQPQTSSTPKTSPPQSKAAELANQLYDQANGSSSPSATNGQVLTQGESVRISPSIQSSPPKINQNHDFGPIAPTIGQTEVTGSTVTSPSPIEELAGQTVNTNPLSARYNTNQVAQPANAEPSSGLESESRLTRLTRMMKLKHILTKRNAIYAGIGLVSFLVFYLIFNFQNLLLQINYAFNKPKAEPAITIPDATQLTKNPEPAAAPPGNVIIIPKINVNAPIVVEPSTDENAVQTALRNGVVHYGPTGKIGQPGNAVIVGHSSMDPWSPGSYKYVFALLEKVGVGDQIQINQDQKKYVYQVQSTKVVPPTDLSVLNPTSEPTITLITCTPVGTNWRRFIVSAKQVEPLTKPQIAINETPKNETTQIDLPGKSPLFMDKVRAFFQKLFGQG